jgi:outer membrane biosynthesis protein TonB
VLVALIAALLWFKLRKTDASGPQAPVIQSMTAPKPPPPAFDLPPPPPPEDAGSDAEADSGQRKPSLGPVNVCAMKCEGTSTGALDSALRGAAGASRGCYERALRTNSMLQGRVTVAVRVGPNGSVCSASIAQDSLHSSEVTSCVLGLFRGRPFPPPAGGSCVDASIPISFTPQEKK